jgi:biopolymer transport protein ExbD
MKFKRTLEARPVVDLVPMIDVVFQLILFFLVSTTFAVLPGISLDLPKSTTAESIRTNGITITVGADDTLFLNAEKVAIEDLDSALNALAATGAKSDVPVSLEADAQVPNGTIVKVLDSLRRTGYTGVNLRTKD